MDNVILIIYGLLLIAGGYFGFKKGSKVSLVMGTASGLMAFLGLWLVGLSPKGGWVYLSVLTGILALVFLMRLIKTRSFMPAGMLLLMNASMVAYCIMALVRL